ncbi:PREDICTED: inner centromere protein A [Ceratosolen solmsi marchali]|uniref:Inner centromere protein A n=1 Tax=Ceratosolen solmsi marchali TaxID=326594 RepID=A0AAJ6YIU8_9HYME|nr:PREDICTED: inner centromere protein A [Ceratosolen solmsi marchali]
MDNITVLKMLQADFTRFYEESQEITKTAHDLKKDASNYIRALISQIKSGSGPLLAKTPKISKKKGPRIKAIPECIEMENTSCLSIPDSSKSFQADIILETSDIRTCREKRGASVRAADIIKKQQSINLTLKLRRPSKDTEVSATHKIFKETRSKRPKASLGSSDEEDIRPPKHSKMECKKSVSKLKIIDKPQELSDDLLQSSEENEDIDSRRQNRTSVKRKLDEQNKDEDTTLSSEQYIVKKSLSNDEPVVKKANYSKSPPQKNEKDPKYFAKLERISEISADSNHVKKSNERITRSSSVINAQSLKKSKVNNINESMEISNSDVTAASMYEDAIGKPIPIMNSTMNPNTTAIIDKIMNVTVLIEPLSSKKILNETVTIKKNSLKESVSHNNSTIKEVIEENNKQSAAISNANSVSENAKKLLLQTEKQIEKFNELITDDESSPERKEYNGKKEQLKKQQRLLKSNVSSISDEDEILRTPMKLAKPTKDFKVSSIKSMYKKAALFSPYAKDSVKKRVEAFEQVATSPKQNEHETAGRVTRTKTRALAAASFSEDPVSAVKQKLARKSLAKAKKISLAKQVREFDDTKENEHIKYSKSKSSLERSAHKLQSKNTPLGKNRILQMPSSISKLQHTPSNTHNLNAYSKPLTASRGNIVTHVDSFIQPLKSASKPYDRSGEEKRRKVYDEDARRKREDLLKAQAEEKRRKREEKELKNKLAREAKERLDYEKRLKAEKEKEEKAKLAQQLQEKQKEEMERKRIAQLHRAQEKEEKRKQDELTRLQRIQDQEEQERLLAEQKRREQEMEKRKQAEMRHQMAELKMKNQMENKILQQAKAKAVIQKQTTENYKIDSDPDEEESDDENKPKHQIPPWASKHVRQTQLAMQQHIPMKFVLKFFDAKKCTPDLRDLFQGIDPKKLKRSSSAIWKTPPRFSMMNCSIIKD